MTDAREAAESSLLRSGRGKNPLHRQARALAGIGWALLDLADALREPPTPTYSQVEFGTDADTPNP